MQDRTLGTGESKHLVDDRTPGKGQDTVCTTVMIYGFRTVQIYRCRTGRKGVDDCLVAIPDTR